MYLGIDCCFGNLFLEVFKFFQGFSSRLCAMQNLYFLACVYKLDNINPLYYYSVTVTVSYHVRVFPVHKEP